MSQAQPVMTALAKLVMQNERERRVQRVHGPDLTGERFGRLTVIRRDYAGRQKPRWQCICTCGGVSLVSHSNLMGGYSRSCGCLRNEIAAVNIKKNGKFRWAKTRKAAA